MQAILRAGCSFTAVLAITLIASATPAVAADFTVGSTADAVDANPGDGFCRTSTGACTLRAAVQEANMRMGADTITLPGGTFTLRIAPDSLSPPQLPGAPFFDPGLFQDYEGDLDIGGPTTITGAGAGATIVESGPPPLGSAPEQTALDRVLEIHAGAGNVTIADLTVRRGYSSDPGGGIMNSSAGRVRLVDMVVSESVAVDYGGGIHSGGPLDGVCSATCPVGDGRLELVRTSLFGNRTEGKGGGVFVTQSGLTVTGTASHPALFSGNHAGEGGAIYNGGEATPTGSRGRVDVSHAEFRDNVALADAGAIYNEHEGDMAVADSAFTGNLAWGDGGAIDSGSKTSATIARSEFEGNRAGGNGGAVNTHPERTVAITGSEFTDNHAGVDLNDELGQFHEGEGGGGAVALDGTGGATIRGSRFDENSSSGEAGALAVNAGGTVLVADSTFTHNEAEISGGAILNAGMRVTFDRLVVDENKAFEDGGGIDNQGSGEFTVRDTTISRNTAHIDGGGVVNRPDSLSRFVNTTIWDNRARVGGGGFDHESDADTHIENTTISGNVALVYGGGLFVDADGGLRVINSTITQNTSPAGSGVGKPIESINFPIEPSLGAIFRNSIVAGNRMSPDCNGAWASEGGNFDGGDDCYFAGPRDRTNVNPRLDAIADNGGATMTHAPQPDSHAIDGGLNSVTTLIEGATIPCVETDQRGIVRPRNGHCDVGAVEYEGPFPPEDGEAPEVTIDEDAPTQVGEYAKFRFSGTDDVTDPDDLVFECRIRTNDPTDPEPVDPTEPVDPLDPELWWHGCSSGWPGDRLQIEDGQNVLEVRAYDRAGNLGEPDEHPFVGGQDVTAPETTLTGHPDAVTTRNSAVFTFSAEDEGTPRELIEFECRLDGGDWEAFECLNPMSFSNLSVGQHSFQVRALDEADNIDASPATFSWRIEAPSNCDEANVSVGASADAYVDEGVAVENFGISESLEVRSGAFGENARALVRFGLPSGLSGDCELVSARLRLYSDSDPGRTLRAIPITESWNETGVTWMNQPDTAGVPAATGSGAGYREWDVTAHVAEMLDEGSSNGWLIRDAAEGSPEDAESSFSSRNTIAEPPQVPKLVLRFTGETLAEQPGPPSEELEENHVECGEVLTESTLVVNDLSCSMEHVGDALVIGAPGIVVDLGGHTIDGPDFLLLGQEENLAAGIRNVGHDNVVIRNGTVQEFGVGVSLMSGVRWNRVEHLKIERNALAGVELWDADDGRNGNVVADNDFAGNEAGVALLAGTEYARIADNDFVGDIGVSLFLQEADFNVITGNLVLGIPIDPNLDSDGGMLLEGSSDNEITDNELTETGDAGVVLSAGSHRNRVELNTLTRTGDAGVSIEDSDGNAVVDNIAHLASDAGVSLNNANEGLVLENDVRFNPTGVDLGGDASGNRIEGNDADGSGGTGIEIGAGSLRNVIVDNEASGTEGDGIAVDGDALDPETGDPVDGNVVEGNVANDNLSDGITAGAGHRLADNTAHNNAGWGIDGEESSPGEAGVVDGGGNEASGNGELEQCRGVDCDAGAAPPPPLGPDVTAPNTIIDEAPEDGSSGTELQVFRFSGTDDRAPSTALHYECRLDPPPDPVIPPEPPEPPEPGEPVEPVEPVTEHWEPCASPVRIRFMLSGEHRFEVRAIDPADHVDATPDVHEWSVSAAAPGLDSTPPSTAIVEGPADPSHDTTPTFRFRASDNSTPGPDLRFQCNVDGAGWSPCGAVTTLPELAYGERRLQVRAVDVQDNEDLSPAVHEWTLEPAPPDLTPPHTTIESGPDPRTVQTSATFELSSNEEGATFECSLDALDAWQPCATPRTFVNLAVGDHDLYVRAVDAAGNPDATPAHHEWTVAVPPVLRTVSCGQVLTSSTLVNNDLTDCTGDGLVIGAEGITLDLNGHTITGAGLGAGVRNDGRDWVTITGDGRIEDFDHGVLLGAGTAHNVVTGVNAQLNQENGILLSNADDGTNGNTIRANLLTQNSMAGVAVTGGTQDTLVTGNTIGGNPGAGVHLSASSGTRVTGNAITASSEAGVLLEGAGGNVIADNELLGNSGEAIAVTLASNDNRIEDNLISDGAKGVVILQSNGTEFVGNAVDGLGDTAVTLEESNDSLLEGNDIGFNSGGFEIYRSSRNRIVDNDVSENSSDGILLKDFAFENVVTGNTVNANDAKGIMVEVEAPAGSGTLIRNNRVTANGSDGISIQKVGHTVASNVANDNMGWGIYATVATAIGGNVDGGGNRAANNNELLQCFEIRCDGTNPHPETIPPETEIDDAPAAASALDRATFRFSGSDNSLLEVTFQCRLDGGAWAACVSPHSIEGLDPGDRVFEVRAVDHAGTPDPTPARHDWTYEPLPPGVAPDTTIESGPDAVTVSTSATFTLGSNEPGVEFECSLDGAAFAACASPRHHTGLSVGDHVFRARAVDGEDLRDASPAQWAWRVGPPPVAAAVACGQVITQSVRVTNSLLDCPADGLVIGAHGITLDLEGHTIDGTGLGAGIRNPQYDGVTITDGSVQEFEVGVAVDPSDDGVVSSIGVTLAGEAGIRLAGTDGAAVRGNTLSANEGDAIVLTGGARETVVRGNGATGNLGRGLWLDGATATRIEDNTISASGDTAITLEGATANTLTGNSLAANSGGIDLLALSHGNYLSRNAISSGEGGIQVIESNAVEIAENDVEQTSGAALIVDTANGAIIRRNDFRFSDSGVEVSDADGARIASNDVAGTSGTGISVDGASLNTEVVLNTLTSNGSEGIEVSAVAPAGQGTLIDRNTAMRNGSEGIIVDGSGHTVVANAAHVNGGWGLYVEPGNVDGGGNVAAGNVEPAQCFGIVCTDGGFVVPGTPNTTVLDKPTDPTGSRRALFTFTGDDDNTLTQDLEFQCRLDSADELDWVECENPQVYENVSPGRHEFEVRAVDGGELVDPTPDSWSWTYTPLPPNVAPDTEIDFGPPAQTPSLDAVFQFSANEPDATFECRMDNGPWDECATDPDMVLAGVFAHEHEFEDHEVGPHRFEVRAVDVQGIRDPSPARHDWRITGVITTIFAGPAFEPGEGGEEPSGGETEETTATFDFAANVSEAEFECSLDMGPFSPCTPPVTYSGLTPGEHLFRVVATDPEGQMVQVEPTEYEWTVLPATDVTPPETTLIDGPGDGTSDMRFEFTGTDDQTAPAALTFECRLDSALEADWYDCASPHNLLEEFPPEEIAPGDHRLEIRAVDLADPDGNVDPSPVEHEWTSVADTVEPQTLMISTPPASTLETAAVFEFTGTDNATPMTPEFPLLAFECSLDGAAFEECESPHEVQGLEGGAHELRVRAVDLAGNADSSPAEFDWHVIGAPETTITSPAPAAGATSATFTFESDQANSTFECSLDGSSMEPCESPLVTDLGGPGEHVFEVQATNEHAMLDETPATVEWVSTAPADTTPPDTTIVSGPDPVTTLPDAVFTFRSSQLGSEYECSLDGEAFGDCSSPFELTVTSAPHLLAVRAVDPAGNADPTPATYEWEYDGPPVAEILAGPEEQHESPVAEFLFTSNDAGSTFECFLDGEIEPCDSPATYSGLTLGPHAFAVRAIDPGGQVGNWEEWEWTVLAPAPPQTTLAGGPPAGTVQHAATFELASTDPGSTFECSVDAGAFAPCATPVELTGLAAGEHLLLVRATDAFGNTDASPAEHEWTVHDAATLDTSIGFGPPAETLETEATFAFTANAADATFECSLDGAAFEPCESPVELSGLEPDPHEFAVRALDASGTPEATPAERAWTVVGNPVTTFTEAPDALTTEPDARFVFAADQAGVTYLCSFDGHEPEPCTSPVEIVDVGGGDHTFEVEATNGYGLVEDPPAMHEWTVDGPPESTAPQTVITAGPPATTGAIEAMFEFGGSDNVTPALELDFECSLDGGPFESCATPHELSDLPAGDRRMEVRAVDAAGNVDASPAVHTWHIQDVIAPETAIDTGPESETTETSATFTFSSDEAGSTFQCSLDGGAFAACTSPRTITGLSLGDHTFRVRARDAAGNQDASPDVYEWLVEPPPDTVAPNTTIVSGPPTFSNSASAEIRFSADEAVDGFECSLDGAAFTACDTPHSVSGLTNAPHALRVRAIDLAGNVDGSPAVHSWTVDTVAPQTTITSAPATGTTSTSASFAFNASEAGSTFQCSLDGGAFAACTSPRAYSGLTTTAHEFRVRAVDPSGNTDGSAAVHSWTIGSACSGSTATLGANIDSWVLQSSSGQNYGTDSVLKVDTKSGANARGLVRFNLPTVPAGCTVTNARLRLYATSYKTGRTLQALQLGAAWTESAVRWNNQPATTGTAVITASGSGYREWNVTAHVQGMYTGANHGWLIRDQTENGNGLDQAFHSREKGSDNPPRLVVTFGAP